jgi:mannose-1-phosphate guanylyltransferase/mannose-6-phosphate isomerase
VIDLATLFPVILSGGSGTRLWPLSRAMYPKQFISFFSDTDPSFLGATLRRLPSGAGFARPILLCNNDHRFLVREELERAGITPEAIYLEPIARNTAPAIAVAALAVAARDPDGILVVMPSDHVIDNAVSFADAVQRAARVAARGRLVLFGIKPNSPHVGYGYIRCGAALPDGDGSACSVDAFVEKPDAATAQTYLDAGNYLWNSGIFVLHARTFIDELQRLAPDILAAAQSALDNAREDLDFLRLDANAFASAPSISVDYAVMERTKLTAVLQFDVGWSDVGSWSSLWDIADLDANDNYARGDAILEDSTGLYVHSERSLVATIGVKDLIIIDTPDALLVADKTRAQDVTKIVARLKSDGRREHEQHVRNYRPWGFFETLSVGPRFQVKLLHVKPGAKLSMQRHHHRSEHWVVVHGTAKVVIGETEQLVRENESVYIVATQWHRLENPGKVPVEIIEVQIGSYLGEDDIERTDDIYHRAADETK